MSICHTCKEKKNGIRGRKKKAPALTHSSNDCPNDFPQNNLYTSVYSIRVLCMLSILSHKTFKKILNTIINFKPLQEYDYYTLVPWPWFVIRYQQFYPQVALHTTQSTLVVLWKQLWNVDPKRVLKISRGLWPQFGKTGIERKRSNTGVKWARVLILTLQLTS